MARKTNKSTSSNSDGKEIIPPRFIKKGRREVLGGSRRKAFGRDSRFQVDATMVDVYCVSRSNRTQIIGQPVIDVVIDVFSRMVVGLGVKLEENE